MVLLTILMVLLIAVNVVFYILATGKFARIDTRASLLKGDVRVSFEADAKRTDLLSGRIDKILEVLENQKGDIGLLAGDIGDIKEEMGDIKLDILALQHNAANSKEPITAVLPATTVAKNGRRSTAKKEVK